MNIERASGGGACTNGVNLRSTIRSIMGNHVRLCVTPQALASAAKQVAEDEANLRTPEWKGNIYVTSMNMAVLIRQIMMTVGIPLIRRSLRSTL